MCKYTPIVPELLAATRSATLPKLQFSCLAFPRLQVVTKTRNYQTRKKRCYLLEKLQYFCCLSFTCSSYLSPLLFLLHCHVTFFFRLQHETCILHLVICSGGCLQDCSATPLAHGEEDEAGRTATNNTRTPSLPLRSWHFSS